jgi:hydrogenase-4 component F
MAAGLGFAGPLGALGVSLHMLFHAVTKPLLFFCAGNVQQHFGTQYFWKVRGVIHTLPWTGALFLMGTLAVTGTPPFSIFQSEFTILSAAVHDGRSWTAFLFLAGVVTIFAGQTPLLECRWKLTAMVITAVSVVVLGFWLPGPVYHLVQQTARIIEGMP